MDMVRDPRVDPRKGDIVRSNVYKNGRERHVTGREMDFVHYLAVSPSATVRRQCRVAAWRSWCVVNRTDVPQIGT